MVLYHFFALLDLREEREMRAIAGVRAQGNMASEGAPRVESSGLLLVKDAR